MATPSLETNEDDDARAHEIVELARMGYELSRQQLLQLYDGDGDARPPLRDALLPAPGNTPMMLPQLRSDLLKGSLGPKLGSFLPVRGKGGGGGGSSSKGEEREAEEAEEEEDGPSEPYASLWKRARGDVPYCGIFSKDAGNFVGSTDTGQQQCIASCVLSLLLWADKKQIDLCDIVCALGRFAMSGTSPNGKYALVPGGAYGSAMTFPCTGIGGYGEFLLVECATQAAVGALQVCCEPEDVRRELAELYEEREKPDTNALLRVMMGNAALIYALCFGESEMRSDGSRNLYWWGPRRLEQIGIA